MLASLFALLPLLALTSASPINKRATGQLIESAREPGYCLSVQGGRAGAEAGQIYDGTFVVTQTCALSNLWDISKGSGSVVPGNNGPLKIWTSYPGALQQTWYLTDDNRIAQTGGNQCIDEGNNAPQTYQCTTGNTNQIYYVKDPAPSSTSSSSSAPAATSAAPFDPLSYIPHGPFILDTPGSGQRIHPASRSDLCVTVAGGVANAGGRVGLTTCFNDQYAVLQEWSLPTVKGQKGEIKLFNQPDLCLTAGADPGNNINGVGAIIDTCKGSAAQQWYFDGTTYRAGNQCLDIANMSPITYESPYNTVANVQTWECSTNGDPFQAFKVIL